MMLQLYGGPLQRHIPYRIEREKAQFLAGLKLISFP